MDNDIVGGRGMREGHEEWMEKMEKAAPAKREIVVVEGEMTLKKERENNGEFNMAPRGSFNYLIESPAYLSVSPPRRLHLASSLSHRDKYLRRRADDYLKDEFARVPFPSPLVPFALRSSSRAL